MNLEVHMKMDSVTLIVPLVVGLAVLRLVAVTQGTRGQVWKIFARNVGERALHAPE